MLKSKYRKEKEALLQDLLNKGSCTIMLQIILKGTSKVKNHFIYECTYLDQGEEKELFVIAEDMCRAVEKIKPLVNKDISDSQAQFIVGSEDVVLSRLKSN
tara:strand:- start:41 stop:343 length:303 start_codon:yes stop_codon:yes gene_type:complete